jgi:hypothetical protein
VSVIILMDFSQVTLANILSQMGNHTNIKVEEGILRHMVLNSIRMYKTKHGAEYGELIITCDSRNYWRKQVFPYYKANRKKSRDASELDWKGIFDCLSKIKEELKEYFPYRVIDVDGAEADDVIGTLCQEYGNTNQKILVLSADKDFQQLQTFINVEQFDPINKKKVQCNNPEQFLLEHIIKGDAGDGIPNILSDDNTFVIGKRQTPVTQKKMDALTSINLSESVTHIAYRNYMRNKQLIDLTQIPDKIRQAILESYHAQADKKSNNLLNYFIVNKLRNLTDSIGDFV